MEQAATLSNGDYASTIMGKKKDGMCLPGGKSLQYSPGRKYANVVNSCTELGVLH